MSPSAMGGTSSTKTSVWNTVSALPQSSTITHLRSTCWHPSVPSPIASPSVKDKWTLESQLSKATIPPKPVPASYEEQGTSTSSTSAIGAVESMTDRVWASLPTLPQASATYHVRTQVLDPSGMASSPSHWLVNGPSSNQTVKLSVPQQSTVPQLSV